jgi:hypothetical protein
MTLKERVSRMVWLLERLESISTVLKDFENKEMAAQMLEEYIPRWRKAVTINSDPSPTIGENHD